MSNRVASARRPADEVGELDHPGTVADRAVRLSGRTQSSSWTSTRASRTPWSMANPMKKSQLAAVRRPRTRGCAGRVGPHQDGVGDESGVVVTEVAGLVLLGSPDSARSSSSM